MINFDCHHSMLDNGAKVVLCPRPHVSQSHVALYINIGSRHESPASNGLTHVLEHMLFRGTKSYADATALNTAAENIGGFLEGATYRDHMVLSTSCHHTELQEAIAIMGEIVCSPRYDNLEIERDILREEILEGLDEHGNHIDIDNTIHRIIFGAHGLGMPIEGTLENLNHFEIKHLEAHRRQFLVGRNTVICISGAMDIQKAFSWVHNAFCYMPQGETNITTPPSLHDATAPCAHVPHEGSQVDLRLSYRSLPMHHPQYATLVLLNRILTEGLSSRLHAELIDKQGLAYMLQGGITTYSDCGLFDFEAAVAPDKAVAVARAIKQFANNCSNVSYSQSDIKRAIKRYQYDLEFMNDSSVDLASWYGCAALFGIEAQQQALLQAMQHITEDHLRTLAQCLFHEHKPSIVAVGSLQHDDWQRIIDA